MKKEDVIIGNLYQLNISDDMKDRVVWSRDPTPQAIVDKWPTPYDANNQKVKIIGDSSSLDPQFIYESEVFAGSFLELPSEIFPIKSDFLSPLDAIKPKAICNCNLWISGCTCGVFKKEMSSKS